MSTSAWSTGSGPNDGEYGASSTSPSANGNSSRVGFVGPDRNSSCRFLHAALCRTPGTFIPDSQLGQWRVGVNPAGKPGILGSGCDGTGTATSSTS